METTNFDNFAANANAMDQELSWDAVINTDAPEYVLLPEGDYDFAVEKYERNRFNGSDKIPPCNQLTVFLLVANENGEMSSIRHNFFMLKSKEGFIGSFLTSLGLKKENEAIKLDLDKLVGASGRAHVTVRTYNDKQYNNISKFLKPANNTPKSTTGFQGKF